MTPDLLPGALHSNRRRRVGELIRNGRLLLEAATQHAIDDPTLLLLQASRRLPMGPRLLAGRALERIAPVSPGLSALGSLMIGRTDRAEEVLVPALTRRPSRLAGEVAIQLGRPDLLGASSPAPTRARAAFAQGDVDGAIGILENAGRGESRYARRLRSERDLLTHRYRVSVPGEAPAARTVPPPRPDEPLRVLHLLTNSLPHTQSGYSLRTHRILLAMRDAGIESVALTRTGYPVMVGLPLAADEDLVDGIRYVRTLPPRLPQTQEERVQAEIARALELVAEFRPHVLHTTTNYLNAHVARTVSEVTGIPWIFEVRGLMEETWVASQRTERARETAAASQKHALIVAAETELAREADGLVTLSATMADALCARGIDRDRIVLVPNAVDQGLLQDGMSPAQAREEIGLVDIPGFGADAMLVGAVSALVDYEGFDVLMRAVALVVRDPATPAEVRDRIRMVLAGDGVSRPGLLELADELGIADRVLLPGRVPRDHARRWVEALDVVVVPRLDVAVARAVTPQKPVEAMALGRPLIVSDLPALRETVRDGTGSLAGELVGAGDPVQLAQTLVRLLADPGRRAALGRQGRESASRRSWPTLVGRYDAVYRAVATVDMEETTSGE
ncbi:glycosyltransferase [Brachybacterium hainanense]|uniref:Glycosyltransferase n=1 Tax=Brachybacterium hainanense TaxID=1541174 RepID=A0ABV6RFB8_9MICO